MDQDVIRLKDIKSELTGYLGETMQLLKKSTVPDDDSVHDMRVLLKKSRAALKLVAPQVESEFKDKDIQSLKEAAKLMTSWRDTTVHRKTLKDLKKEHPVLFEQLADNERITNLLRKAEVLAEPSAEMKAGVESIEALLKKSMYRIRFQNMQNFDANILLKEVEGTYLTAVEHFLICRNNPKEAKLHEMRKRIKDFLYQLHFFRPLNSQAIKTLEKKLDSLTRNLGKINDIAQLIKALDYSYPNENNSPALDELVVRMREKQDRYLNKVWPVASRLFSPGRNLVNLLGYKILVI